MRPSSRRNLARRATANSPRRLRCAHRFGRARALRCMRPRQDRDFGAPPCAGRAPLSACRVSTANRQLCQDGVLNAPGPAACRITTWSATSLGSRRLPGTGAADPAICAGQGHQIALGLPFRAHGRAMAAGRPVGQAKRSTSTGGWSTSNAARVRPKASSAATTACSLGGEPARMARPRAQSGLLEPAAGGGELFGCKCVGEWGVSCLDSAIGRGDP
jgi:hypothetical protein